MVDKFFQSQLDHDKAMWNQKQEESPIKKMEFEKKYGMENHPKKDGVWKFVWNKGQDYCWNTMESWYSDLSKLVKD